MTPACPHGHGDYEGEECPSCEDGLIHCRECGEWYSGFDDGWDGICGDCADKAEE